MYILCIKSDTAPTCLSTNDYRLPYAADYIQTFMLWYTFVQSIIIAFWGKILNSQDLMTDIGAKKKVSFFFRIAFLIN